MNYFVYTQKGAKLAVLIAKTKYRRDGAQLLMSYKKGYVLDNKDRLVFTKGDLVGLEKFEDAR